MDKYALTRNILASKQATNGIMFIEKNNHYVI